MKSLRAAVLAFIIAHLPVGCKVHLVVDERGRIKWVPAHG